MTITFNKHRQQWVYQFTIAGQRSQGYCVGPDGKPITTKKAARDAEAVVRKQLLNTTATAPNPRDLVLSEIVAELTKVWQVQKGWEDKKRYVTEIVAFFGKDELMRVVSSKGKRTDYTNHQKLLPRQVWLGGPDKDADKNDPDNWRTVKGKFRSHSTINKYNGTLQQIIEHAEGKVDAAGNPLLQISVKSKALPKLKRKARPIPEPVLQRLMELLPKHVIEAQTITLIFGFRKSEAFRLTVRDIDWQAGGVHLFAENVKGKADMFLPTTPAAMRYLRTLADQAADRGVKHLISYREGKDHPWRSMKDPKTAWKRAMNIIEAEFDARWRWHDLRAAFITHVALTSGLAQAQALARHSDLATTQMYIGVADKVLRSAGERAAVRPALTFMAGDA